MNIEDPDHTFAFLCLICMNKVQVAEIDWLAWQHKV